MTKVSTELLPEHDTLDEELSYMLDEQAQLHTVYPIMTEVEVVPVAPTKPEQTVAQKQPSRRQTDFGAVSREERSPLQVDIVTQYLNEIGKTPLLTKEEEKALSARVRTGHEAQARLSANEYGRASARKRLDERVAAAGREAKQTFILANLRLVVSVARKYNRGNKTMDLLDLIQEGNLGLEHAVDKFDGRKGYKFSTYSVFWIKQAIGRSVIRYDKTVRFPDDLASVQQQLHRFENEAKTDAEIMYLLGIDQARLDALRDMRLLEPNSLDRVLPEGDADLHGIVKDPSGEDGYDQVTNAVDKTMLRAALVKHAGDKLTSVVMNHFGLEGSERQTFDVIGKSMGVTKERVRSYNNAVLTMIQHPAMYLELVRSGLLSGDSDDERWKLEAVCEGVPAINFFNLTEQTTGIATDLQVKKFEDSEMPGYCSHCPVHEQCLAYGQKIPRGAASIWGGVVLSKLSPRQATAKKRLQTAEK